MKIATKSQKSIIVIPARMQSTRLPQKMMLAKTGKPLIQHTYEAACRAGLPADVIVATDHQKIFDAVVAFDGKVQMTDENAQSGTDRVAEVARKFPDVDIIANVQGDEPEISANAIDLAIRTLQEDSDAVMSTLATPIRNREKIEDPACVKVVFDDEMNAMYFSRSVIPHPRDGIETYLDDRQNHFFQHIGLYCYRRSFLDQITTLPVSSLETIENLEQLRVLQNGFRIKVAIVDEPTKGIDTEKDYEAFVKRCGY